MQPVRSLILRHRALAALLLLCALLTRALVPVGYMPVAANGAVTLQWCPGTMPTGPTAASMAGGHHAMGGRHGEPAKAEQPCAFAGLAAPALASADPVLLAAGVAFAVLLVLLSRPLALPAARPKLRPPLRGPPLPV